MSGKSNIEWTQHTWNPFAGCAVLSPGCTNCYAMKMAARLDAMGQSLYRGLTKPSKAGPVWRGTVRANPDALLAPLRRKKPTTYFVNSMSDLFYEKFDDELIDRVFAVMALSPQHTFQVLTKRAERMRDYFAAKHPAPNVKMWQVRVCEAIDGLVPQRHDASRAARHAVTNALPLKNIWLGVSTERQQEADERIPLLLQTPAAVRFISAEPLLGPIDLIGTLARYQDTPDHNCAVPLGRQLVDWVIVGGESGHNARPMHPDWARSLRDQCAAAGVSFFFKQWGEFGDYVEAINVSRTHALCGAMGAPPMVVEEWPQALEYLRKTREIANAGVVARVGKKAAGRILDGIEHNDMPKVTA